MNSEAIPAFVRTNEIASQADEAVRATGAAVRPRGRHLTNSLEQVSAIS